MSATLAFVSSSNYKVRFCKIERQKSIPAYEDDSWFASLKTMYLSTNFHRFYFFYFGHKGAITSLFPGFLTITGRAKWTDSNHQIVKYESLDCSSRLSICAHTNICITFSTNYEYLPLFFNLKEVFLLIRPVCQPCLFVCVLHVCVCVLDARELDGIYCCPLLFLSEM